LTTSGGGTRKLAHDAPPGLSGLTALPLATKEGVNVSAAMAVAYQVLR
jgi:hypothetical protein